MSQDMQGIEDEPVILAIMEAAGCFAAGIIAVFMGIALGVFIGIVAGY